MVDDVTFEGDVGDGFLPAIAFLGCVVVASCAACVFLRAIFVVANAYNGTVITSLEEKEEKDKKDEFYEKYHYSYDVVIVFKTLKEEDAEKLTKYQKNKCLAKVQKKIQKAGLETMTYLSVQKEETFLCIRASPAVLQEEADRTKLNMLLDSEKLESLCKEGTADWDPIEYDSKQAFDNIFAEYDRERDGQVDPDCDLQIPYKTHDVGTFRDKDRLKLIKSMIENTHGRVKINLGHLVAKKAALAVMPLHDYRSLLDLESKWIVCCMRPGYQPNDLIRDYFGAKIALYFAFINLYTAWLIPSAVAGIGCWVVHYGSSSNPDNISIPFITVFISIWSVLFIENWKRKRFTLTQQWGMIGFEDQELMRPEFQIVASNRTSKVTGKTELFYPRRKILAAFFCSISTIFTFITIVIAAIIGIYLFRSWVQAEPLKDWAQVTINGEKYPTGLIIASFMNSIQIMIFDIVYGKVASILTIYENHKTDTQFEDSLIAKTFCFRFVNSYISLFYIAFMKEALKKTFIKETACEPNCISELSLALGIIFMTNIIVGNITEVFVPFVLARMKAKKEGIVTTKVNGRKVTEILPLTLIEKQFLKLEYDPVMGLFKDYNELIIQFGYCTLFVAAFPLATVLALVNNFVEARVDAWKLCQTHRRPWPTGAEDIGTWLYFLRIMSVLAIITNMAIFCFTGSLLDHWSMSQRIVMFVVAEHALLVLQSLVATLIPDVPDEIKAKIKREEFIVSKVVDDIADGQSDDDSDSEVADQREIKELQKDIKGLQSKVSKKEHKLVKLKKDQADKKEQPADDSDSDDEVDVDMDDVDLDEVELDEETGTSSNAKPSMRASRDDGGFPVSVKKRKENSDMDDNYDDL